MPSPRTHAGPTRGQRPVPGLLPIVRGPRTVSSGTSTGRTALARRLAGTGVTATCVHPGVVRTNFGAEDQAWFFTVIRRLILPLLKTPAHGAQTAIYLAASPDMDGVTGQFFVNRKPKTANKVAYDTDMTRRLWRVSADLVGMTPTSV